ncbi:hypothetical protein [Asticcacaulis excentricus]|uniref:hypothetical protein n=1 Tax=Asticcacaulis excentricus TaxID=78587 RepID=UPI000F8184D1|nr:hypothetical protein [Asticcacaulis excentricus]
MVSERTRAKSGIVAKVESDDELADTMGQAHQFQLDLARENNSHQREMLKISKGWLGQFFGNDGLASTFAAMSALFLALVFAGVCAYLASKGGDNVELWKQMIDKCLTLATAALGFIFGRGIGGNK